MTNTVAFTMPEETHRPLLRFVVAVSIAALAGCSQEAPTSGLIVELLPTIAAADSAEPHLSSTSNGAIVMSWLEPEVGGVALKWSQLNSSRWSEPLTVATGNNWFVNWADFPSVSPMNDNLWAAHWLVKRPGGTYAYDVAISISADAGRTWADPITPHEDRTATEHGFVSLFPSANGVAALWLDGRNMQPSDDGHGHGGMTLRSAIVGVDGDLTGKTIVDELVCDCCQTDVALTASGPVAVYRNRTEDEIRDIYVARIEDGQWQSGVPLAEDGWKIAGCPVNGPAIDAIGQRVATVWFTAANENTKVRFANSTDSGRTFADAIDIATDRPIGRVDTALLDDGSALVSWLRSTGGPNAEILIRHVATDGTLGTAHVVATTAAGRMSGFPQMALRDDDVVIAWTDVEDENTQVQTALVGLDGLIRR